MSFLQLIFFIKCVTSARILGIFPTPFYSHHSVFQPIWRELSLRGHQLTIITTNPINDSSLTNVEEIDLSFTYKLVYEDLKIQKFLSSGKQTLILLAYVFFVVNYVTKEQLKHPSVQQLIKSDDQFDLIIAEPYAPAWFGFVKKYKCPLIAISSIAPTNFFKRIVGDIDVPLIADSSSVPFNEDLSLPKKVICAFVEISCLLINNYIFYPLQQWMIRSALQGSDINLYEIFRNVSLFLITEIPGFTIVTTTAPSVIKFDGLQIRSPQILPQELQEFLDGATDGAIYFSLGSVLKSCLIDKEKQDIILDVFRTLPHRVIWKFEGKLENLPPNVKVVSWAPQQDILRHKNTKLFITHGGLQSLDEAVKFTVPLVGFPFFADQLPNMIRAKHLKIGTWLDFESLTTESLQEVILNTVNNKTYLDNLKHMKNCMGHPLKSLDRVVWWIEYVIRHRGAHHLKTPMADIFFHQFYMLDVISFFIVCFIVVFVILLTIVKIVRKWCFVSSNNFS